MQFGVTDLDQLSQIISHATGPAFLLGAVAAFVSILIVRMNASAVCPRSPTTMATGRAASPKFHT